MARGASFWRNPGQWLREKFTPPPPREPPRSPPPPEPPREPPESGDGFFKRIWDMEVSRRDTREITKRSGYSRNEQFQLHTELFASMGMLELEPSEQRQAWFDYLQSFVTNTRRHDDWFREWGMDPRDFDWTAYRAALGYSRRGK